MPVLILSFWNPTVQQPNKGIFIHEQIAAVCKERNDIFFLQVNVLPSKKHIYQQVITEDTLFSNKVVTINIYSAFWKFIYISPWLTYKIIERHLHKRTDLVHPEIVHSNVIFPCGIIGFWLSRKYNSKHLISEHWSKAKKILEHPVHGRLALKAYRESKAVVCVSKFLANELLTNTRHPNLLIIPNIIDTALFTYSTKEFSQKTRFTCVATWKKPKRLDLIITSLLSVAKDYPREITLNVIGEGPQTNEFKNIEYPKNFTIHWLGHISKQEIAAVLPRTDIFLHASEIETFSIVTAEALSTGTPVVASKVGALPELIHDKNGILVENTPEAWIKGIQQIMEKKFDNLAIASETRHKYSPESVAHAINKIYKEILQEK